MERKISIEQLGKAVEDVVRRYKTPQMEGLAPDPRYAGMNEGCVGMTVCLTDGTVVEAGDTEARFAMGSMMRVPMYLQPLAQMPVDDVVDRMTFCKSACGADAVPADVEPRGIHANAIRMASLVAPQGDADGKMIILSDLMTSLMGKSPVLDDRLYRDMHAMMASKDVVNLLAKAGYELYDDTSVALDIVCKLHSMLVNTRMLAVMGATIAADGYNPSTHSGVFDGRLSAPVIAMMASKGPKRIGKAWILATGLPAMSSSAGAVVAVLPGFGSVAAYSPLLAGGKVAAVACRAVADIAEQFGLNVFASARVKAAGA